MASLLPTEHRAAPGIDYRNNRIHWGESDYLNNEGRALSSSLFEKGYDIVFYGHESEYEITSQTATGEFHFSPSDKQADIKEAEEEDWDNEDFIESIVTKSATNLSWAATIDMPEGGKDDGDFFLLDEGCHLELLFQKFQSSVEVCGMTCLPIGPERQHVQFLLMNRDETLRTANGDDLDICRVIEARVEVFGKRLPLFLDPDLFNRSGEENEVDFAQKKLTIYKDMDNWWMKRHFPDLPDLALLHIRSFCSPPPIFFLEEGDVRIQLQWTNHEFTVFIARANNCAEAEVPTKRAKRE